MIKNLGLIPARGGSERLPGKNVIDLGGKPLIAWTIEAALKSSLFDALICSTEDHGIAAVATSCGCSVLHRPPSLAQPDSDSISVVKHAVKTSDVSTICLLQPTSPFRTAEDIVSAYTLFHNNGWDSVVSVTDAPEDHVFEIGHANHLRPKMERLYVPNGAIYLITKKHLEDGGTWYTGCNGAYYMPKERSIDIDTRADLENARSHLQKKQSA
jgi:CMP-N,N'-diacetyllegionaminic acid synthase